MMRLEASDGVSILVRQGRRLDEGHISMSNPYRHHSQDKDARPVLDDVRGAKGKDVRMRTRVGVLADVPGA